MSRRKGKNRRRRLWYLSLLVKCLKRMPLNEMVDILDTGDDYFKILGGSDEELADLKKCFLKMYLEE